MNGFNVTYDIVTEESAADGDFAESGFIGENMNLRDAVRALFETRTCEVGGAESIEADSFPLANARCVTVCNGMEYVTGDYESRSIHFPESMTGASRRRLARLLTKR